MADENSKKRKHQEQDDDICAEEEEKSKREMMSKLPIEIFFDILRRLPIKSLFHCRWVNRFWFNSIKNPSFIEMYHSTVIFDNSPCIIYQLMSYYRDPYFKDLECLGATDDIPMPTLCNPKMPVSTLPIYSCNGLIFSGEKHTWPESYSFFICNPVTGEQIAIAKPTYDDRYDVKSGFGFAPKSKVFKVIRMVNVRMEYWAETDAEVYNCATGNWRIIRNVPYLFNLFYFETPKTNVVVNGAFHWIGFPNLAKADEVIVAFDLETEVFQEVPLPCGFKLDTDKFKQYLVVLGERLCIVHTVKKEHIEIWVMKDYGVESSWVKEYVIKDIMWDDYCEGPYKPIKLMPNGDILLFSAGQSLGYYDPLKKIYRHGGYLIWSPELEPVLHVVSLISPRNGLGSAE
ncbi:hypothetical protein ACHQM5_001130 [Ranunculus cassubicifolius]